MTDSDNREGDVTTYVGRYDPDERPSVSVAQALTEVRDADETDVTLHEYVDPEALDRLFEDRPDGTPRGDGRVTFAVGEYRVIVRSDGILRIEESDD